MQNPGVPGALSRSGEADGKGAPMAIKLLIADDHAYIRMALEGLFAGTDDISVVATCTDGDQVASTAARTEPDVVLMDLDMPRMNGLDATRELLAAQPHVRVLVLTGACDAGQAIEAEAVGAVGLQLKGDDPDDLAGYVRTVAAGGTAWCDPAAAHLKGNRAGRTDRLTRGYPVGG